MWPYNKSSEDIINSNRQFDWILIKIWEKIYCCLLWVSQHWKEIRWNFLFRGKWRGLAGALPEGLSFSVPSGSFLSCPILPHPLPLSSSASLFPHPSPHKTGLGPESGRRRQAEYRSLANSFLLFFHIFKVLNWFMSIFGMKSSGQSISSIYRASQQHVWLYHSTLQTPTLRLATTGCVTDLSNLACPKSLPAAFLQSSSLSKKYHPSASCSG